MANPRDNTSPPEGAEANKPQLLFRNGYSFLCDPFRLAQWLRSKPSTSLSLNRKNTGMQTKAKIA